MRISQHGGKTDLDIFKDHFVPHLQALSYVHNFTIESQILYHAPLSFQPSYESVPLDLDNPDLAEAFTLASKGSQEAEEIAEELLAVEKEQAWLISKDQMKEFVNSERWSLGT